MASCCPGQMVEAMTSLTFRTFASTFALALAVGLASPAAAQTAEPMPDAAGNDVVTPDVVTPDQVTVPEVGAAIEAAPAVDAPVVDAPAVQPHTQSLPSAIAALVASEAVGKTGDLKRRADAVAKFYGARADAPVWLDHGVFTANARAVIARLGAAADDGLDPADFALPDADFNAEAADAAAAAAQEVGLSLAIATFAEQASGGRLVPTSIYKDITRTPERIAGFKALGLVAAATDPVAALDGFNPPEPAFAHLKAKLKELRATAAGPAEAPVVLSRTIKPGMSDPGIPALRQRLGVPEADDPQAELVYDETLAAAVEMFQTENGLAADGVVGGRTLSVLNKNSGDLAGDIVANMEMWRWMPRDLGRDYVFVNVPEFMVRVYRGGQEVHEARSVVGKTTNQTPIFSGEMQYLVVNPYWNVPESIKIKEMLPEIKADPVGYFSRHGYEATWNGQVIDPARIIWDENAVKAVGIRQVPGEANALGHIKFMFPNQHAVYLHDTPMRKLFGRDVRAFSHGCVRVDDPMSFAAAVLDGDPNWNVPKLQALFGGPEQRIDISTHLKVHIAYFTVNVADNGAVQVFDDIYGHVQRIKAAFRRSQI